MLFHPTEVPMRGAFGLVSLLIVILIVMYVFDKIEYPELKTAQTTAIPEAQQLSGHDMNGVPAMDSFRSEEYDRGNQFAGIKITSVMPGGAMDTYYGLKQGDIVLDIGGLDVTALGDFGSANGELQQAYQEQRPLTVDRNGQQITLPLPNTPVAPLPIKTAQNGQPQPQPQQRPSPNQQPPTPTAGGGNNSLPDQLQHRITIPGGF